MIILELFWEFLKIGLFTFGGAYAAIPIIRDSVLSKGWISEEMFGNVVAISESTPGPIMVNAATYIGNRQAGIAGAIAATVGVVLPSFVIILLVAAVMKKMIKNRKVQAILDGIKPAIAGVILTTGLWMALSGILSQNITAFDYKSLIIMVILCIILLSWKGLRKKEFSPIGLIAVSAVLGIIIY